MALPYREFATWTLHDLAIRKRHEDRITFSGNHISAQYVFPQRSPNETDKQYAARVKEFEKTLPRHSDFSERLALAFEALMRAGEKASYAARVILDTLRTAPAAKQAEYEANGIGYAYKPIDSWIGSTRRGHRTKRKKRGWSADERQAETIRAQARRFKREHENFAAFFEMRFELFREQLCRDADWYSAAEKHYTAWTEMFERRSEPFEWAAAMPLATTAHLYHEQRKFSQAALYYRKALRAARVAIVHEELRAFLTHWLRVGVKLCENGAGMIRMPPYDGPWVPEESTIVTVS